MDDRNGAGNRHDPLLKTLNFNLGDVPCWRVESLPNESVDAIDADLLPLEKLD